MEIDVWHDSRLHDAFELRGIPYSQIQIDEWRDNEFLHYLPIQKEVEFHEIPKFRIRFVMKSDALDEFFQYFIGWVDADIFWMEPEVHDAERTLWPYLGPEPKKAFLKHTL
jgi:hypothetical protein